MTDPQHDSRFSFELPRCLLLVPHKFHGTKSKGIINLEDYGAHQVTTVLIKQNEGINFRPLHPEPDQVVV